MGNIISMELLEDELQAVVQAGGYGSEKEAVGHALEVLLAANQSLRIRTAVEIYQQGKVTLSRAAEIAGLEWEDFQAQLAEKGVPLQVDELPEEVEAGAALIHRLRGHFHSGRHFC